MCCTHSVYIVNPQGRRFTLLPAVHSSNNPQPVQTPAIHTSNHGVVTAPPFSTANPGVSVNWGPRNFATPVPLSLAKCGWGRGEQLSLEGYPVTISRGSPYRALIRVSSTSDTHEVAISDVIILTAMELEAHSESSTRFTQTAIICWDETYSVDSAR